MYIIRAIALLLQKLSIIPAVIIIILLNIGDGTSDSDPYVILSVILYFTTGYGWYYALEREIDVLKKDPKRFENIQITKYGLSKIETREKEEFTELIYNLEKELTFGIIIFWWWIALKHLNSFFKLKLK